MKLTKAIFYLAVSLLIGIPLSAVPLLSATTNNTNKQKCSDIITKLHKDKISNKNPLKVAIDYEEATTIETVGSRIVAKFSPQKALGEKIELKELASSLGYEHFNWVSYVEEDPHGIADRSGKILSTPYNDPPKGGYFYEPADEFPFYWDVVMCDLCRSRHQYSHPKITNDFELVFEDVPTDYRLKQGESIRFITHLVGVKSFNLQTKKAKWDTLKTFKWKLTNPTPGRGSVSLIDINVNLENLPQSIVKQMQDDGALISNISAGESCN